MNHSLDDLFRVAYLYYPRGRPFPATGARETPEYHNQLEAFNRATLSYNQWRELLLRIKARFPEARFPDTGIENRAVFMQTPSDTPTSLAFCGWFWLPKDEGQWFRRVGFMISIVIPYYTVYVWHSATNPRHPAGGISFNPAPDEEPFVSGIQEEIQGMYPDHALMPPDVGLTVVPEIHEFGGGPMSRATIFDCLFSDTM